MTTYLTEEEVGRFLPMSHAITAVREAFGALARGEAVNQPRSRIRTGAATGVAADLLARPEAATVGMIGAGWQARSRLEAIAAVRPLREVPMGG